MRNEEGAGQDERTLRGTCFRVAKGGLEIIRRVFEPQRLDLELQRSRASLGRAELIGRQGVKEDRHSWPVGKSLSQQLYLLGCQFQLSIDHARNVAARPRQACRIPTPDKINIDG